MPAKTRKGMRNADSDDDDDDRISLRMRIAGNWKSNDLVKWKDISFAEWSYRFMAQNARRCDLQKYFEDGAFGTPTADDNEERNTF